MFGNKNILLFGSIILIVLAIGLVAILDRTSSPTTSSGDVRARAATVKTLQVNGTITDIDENKGLLKVSDLYIADGSRAGDIKNLGNWTVTTPVNFSYGLISTGMKVTIGVDSSTFLVSKHTLTAVTIVPAK